MYSRLFVLIDPPLESSSVNDSSIEAKIDSSSSAIQSSFFTKFPSSNFAKVIISTVSSWDYVAYGIYMTDGCIVSAFK